MFGDEREDYGAALQRHYANGPPPDWQERFVSPYASSHPWEDCAETWAHYFHMVDTLETACAFGMRVRPRVTKGADLSTAIDFDPHSADLDRIIDAWLPLTFAINSINRSMGIADLYPFVLAPPVIVKLAFIHDRIHRRAGPRRTDQGRGALRAVIAGLKRRRRCARSSLSRCSFCAELPAFPAKMAGPAAAQARPETCIGLMGSRRQGQR